MHQRLASILTGTLFLVTSTITAAPATRPAFLILTTSANLNDTVQRLEVQGARITSRIPPSIVTAELPEGIGMKDLDGVKTMYQSAIPLSVLEPMGVLATAAGMKWNRSLLSKSMASGMSSFGAMRSLVSQKSLSAPMNVSAVQNRSYVTLTWQAVPSALYYEIEAATDAGFSNRVYISNTAALTINAPALEGNTSTDLFYRVRAVDHGDDDKLRANNVFSAWSTTAAQRIIHTPQAVSLNAPAPTSPMNRYQSEGFTLILEWTAIGATRYRVQVAFDKNFETPLFDAVVSEREFICPSPAMEVGDTLYWRVKAWDDAKSEWSDIRQFKIGTPESSKTDFFVNPEAPR